MASAGGRRVLPAHEGQPEDLQVEPGRPVFDVVNIVLDAAGEVVTSAQAVDLRPARHARLHEVAGEIMGDLFREVFDVMRTFGARTDEAHVSAQDVPELGQLIQVPATHKTSEAKQPGVAGLGADMDVVRLGGIRRHAAELPEREQASAGAHASLCKKHGSVGRLAFDEQCEHGHHGCGEDEADKRAGGVDQAFERAVEKPVDREFLDAQHGQAADHLETQAADEDLERGRNDLPFDEGLFAGLDDRVKLVAGKIGARGDEDVDLVNTQGVVQEVGRAERGKTFGLRFAGECDDAGEGQRVGGLCSEIGGEGAGFIVPAEDGDALAEANDQVGTGEESIGHAAPDKHQREYDHVGEDHKPSGDGRLELEHQGQAEIRDEPEGGSLDDQAERLEFPQEQAFFVEIELRVGGDKKSGAQQQQRQIGEVTRVGHVEADAADGSRVTQPVAEGESGKRHEGVTHHQKGGNDDFAQAGGFGHGERWSGDGRKKTQKAQKQTHSGAGASRKSRSVRPGSQPKAGTLARKSSGRTTFCWMLKSTGGGPSGCPISTP